MKRPLLLGRLERYLERVANPDYGDWKGKPRIKPSDLGNPSERRIFYSYLRVPPDHKIKANLKRIFDTGDAFHEMLKCWVKGCGLLIEYRDKDGNIPIDKWTGKPNGEFPITVEELDIAKGKIDAILLIDGKLWIGEFKSAKDEKFKPLEEPMDDHKIQTNTYVHLFEFCLQRGDYAHIKELNSFTEVEGAVYLYIDKNNSELKEFVSPKSDEGLEEVVCKVAKIKNFVDKKELPPCACEPKFFCPWNKKCSKNYNPLD